MKALALDEDAERFAKKEEHNSFLREFCINERSF